VKHTPAILALLFSFGATSMARDHFSDEVKALPAYDKTLPSATPDSWQRTSIRESFSLSLPSCSEAPKQDRHYVHGGIRWLCGTATVEVVWGMRGAESFGEKGKRCTTKVAERRVSYRRRP
jgi:hypothetical protein